MEQNQSFSVEAVAIRIGFEGMTISTIKKGAFYQPDDACCKMFIRCMAEWRDGPETTDLVQPYPMPGRDRDRRIFKFDKRYKGSYYVEKR